MVQTRVDDGNGSPSVGGAPELVLEIAPLPEHVRTARLFAASAARHFSVDEEKIDDLKIAISEACTNSFRAHRDSGATDAVVIAATRVDAGVLFRVVDAGEGFEPHAGSGDIEDTTPAGLFEGNLGLALIRTLFPDAEITRNETRGMTVAFVVSRSDDG